MKIKKDKKYMRKLLETIDCCIILHNMLIDFESDKENEEWYEEDDNVSEIDEVIGKLDISKEIGEQDMNDTRRQRLLSFLSEYDILKI